jgi:hypothetical protein
MNPAHLHLLLNHAPIIGTLVGAGILALALARRSNELTRLSLGFLGIAALAAVPVYLSGEPAEEFLEHRFDVSEALIDQHEAAAQAAAAALGLLGATTLAALIGFRRRPGVPRWLSVGSLILALVTTGLLVRTANLGGRIRHPEIQASEAPFPRPRLGLYQ